MKFLFVSLAVLVAVHVDARLRGQFESERWIWSDNPVKPRTSIGRAIHTTTAKPDKPEPSYCSPDYKPPMPDFQPMSSRVIPIWQSTEETDGIASLDGEAYSLCQIVNRSGVLGSFECFEYIWQMKDRIDRERRLRLCTHGSEDYILGGTFARAGQYPHMGAIGWPGVQEPYMFLCGGSLISTKFVLTAAHCSRAVADTRLASALPKIVRLGYTNIASLSPNASSQDYNVKKIINHPQYRSPSRYYDIALIELGREVIFNFLLQPACLWTKPDFNSIKNNVTVTGWGVTEENGAKGVKDLLRATLDLVESDTCGKNLRRACNRRWCGLRDHQMCAGKKEGGVDVCQGDSGGPIQTRINVPFGYESETWIHHVIGLTSFGYGCGRPDLAGVYTRVYSFLDWIEDVVWPEEKAFYN